MKQQSARRRTLRTVVQTLVAVIAVAPMLVDQLGMSQTAGIGAGIVAVSALLARVMAIPQVDEWLTEWLQSGE